MATLGYILIGIVLIPYVAVPILIWTTQRFGSSFNIRIVQETFLPKEVLTEFNSASEALTKTNFEHCFDAFNQDEFLALRFYHRVFASRIHKTWAICTAICDPEGKLQKAHLELKTEFANHRSIVTHNSDVIGAPIRSSKQKSIALPLQTGAELVAQIHQCHVAKAHFGDLVEPDVANAKDAFKRFLVEEHNEQVDLGALYFDEREKMYRPTWAGAILIGWYSMWPLTLVRRLISNLRIRSLSKEALNG